MTEAENLAELAPELAEPFARAVPRARELIATRLAEALWREDIGDARERFSGEVHAFERVLLAPVDADPLTLVEDPRLRAELASAVTGLALAYARREVYPPPPPSQTAEADERVVAWERLATEGHNLHPCARTRLGWGVADMLAHDLESDATSVGFLGIPEEWVSGDDLGGLLDVPAPRGYRALPVHGWQLGHLRTVHSGLFRDGTLRRLDPVVVARPTAALRTLLIPGGRYLKLSLDIQVTSTRRTISTASTRNGPAISEVLARVVDKDPDGHRILLLPELAGAASSLGTGRDASGILRGGLTGRLEPGEEPIPGSVLPSLVGDLADRHGGGARAFLRDYARLLLPFVLRCAAHSGIGLEAHLQNCVPTFVGGRPHRLGLRDFAGLRVHLGRLAEAGMELELHPGSVIGTGEDEVLLSKVAYTVFQAHLGELVIRLGIDDRQTWGDVRAIVDEVLAGHPDHAFYTAPRVPHKALTRMRLAGSGDVYVQVANALA